MSKLDRENLDRLYNLLDDQPKKTIWDMVLYQANNRYQIQQDESLAFYINQVVIDKVEIIGDATL